MMRIKRAKSGSAPRSFSRMYNKVTQRASIRFFKELESLIITAAFTVRECMSKAISPYVPSTVEEIVAEVAACVTAGASVVHLHAKDKSIGEARSILGLK